MSLTQERINDIALKTYRHYISDWYDENDEPFIIEAFNIFLSRIREEQGAVGYKCGGCGRLDTPPVLRWEGNHLMLGTRSIAVACGGHWGAFDMDGVEQSVEKARRAAEKALGFPDGLIIEEV